MIASYSSIVPLALVLLAAMPRVAQALLPVTVSWRQPSDDGRYVLVMVAPSPNDEDRVDPKAFDLDEIRSIRATDAT